MRTILLQALWILFLESVQSQSDSHITCDDCHRIFRSSQCFGLHKLSKAYGAKSKTLCQAYEKCTICNCYVKPPERRKHLNPHACYTTFYPNFRNFVQRERLCFIVCGKEPKPWEKSFWKTCRIQRYWVRFRWFRRKFRCRWAEQSRNHGYETRWSPLQRCKFAFDFECGIDASRHHYPNMVTLMCLDDDAIEEVFRGKDYANKLILWISKTTASSPFLVTTEEIMITISFFEHWKHKDIFRKRCRMAPDSPCWYSQA